MVTAVLACLVAAAFAPGDSWHYWTNVLWQTNRIGHIAFIPNQSLLGGLSRLAAPHTANTAAWVALVLLALGFGLWRAARAAAAGDEVTGITLTGLVGTLVSPVSWQHHLYWFVPAIVVLIDAGLRRNQPHNRWYLGLAVGIWITDSFSVIAWYDWRIVPLSLLQTP